MFTQSGGLRVLAAALISFAMSMAGQVEADDSPVPELPPIVSRIPPYYPEKAATRGIEGWVHMGFTISRSGFVEDVRVIQADPPELFDEAAMTALRQWVFEPPMVDGQPGPLTNAQVVITFDLAEN